MPVRAETSKTIEIKTELQAAGGGRLAISNRHRNIRSASAAAESSTRTATTGSGATWIPVGSAECIVTHNGQRSSGRGFPGRDPCLEVAAACTWHTCTVLIATTNSRHMIASRRSEADRPPVGDMAVPEVLDREPGFRSASQFPSRLPLPSYCLRVCIV